MPNTRQENQAALRTAQMIALIYSILFVGLIASGYYLLFQRNLFVAVVMALLFPLLAWWLAKYIGSSKGGVRAHIPLFALLLVISAVGVFNSLMLNLEGQRIFVETVEDSIDRFEKLKLRAADELAKGGSDSPKAHMQRVDGLRDALRAEIMNSRNCGEGPVARRIERDLQDELPEFRPISNPSGDCSQNSKIVDDYMRKIDEAEKRAPWSNQSLVDIAGTVDAAKKDLENLDKVAEESFAAGLLREVKPQLEVKNSQYRELYDRLPKSDDANAGLPSHLDLRSVESLGEWSQLINLLLNRLDKATTYVYLLMAIFVDSMMVYLFSLVRRNRPRHTDDEMICNAIPRGM